MAKLLQGKDVAAAMNEESRTRAAALAGQGALIVRVVLLSLHGTEAADGQRPQGILGLPFFPAPDLRSHADGKFVDPDAAGLGRQKVAQLMDCNENAKDQDCRQDINDRHAKSPISIAQHTPPGRGIRR